MTSADPVEPRPEIDPDEVARLREEVARLKAEMEPTSSGRPARLVAAGRGGAAGGGGRPAGAPVGAVDLGERPDPGHRPLSGDGRRRWPATRTCRPPSSCAWRRSSTATWISTRPWTRSSRRWRGRDCRPGPRPRWVRSPARSRPASAASSTTASWRWSPRTPSRRPGSRPTGRPTKSWWRRSWASPGERSRSTTAPSASTSRCSSTPSRGSWSMPASPSPRGFPR